MNIINKLVEEIGNLFLLTLNSTGSMTLMFWDTLRSIPKPPHRIKLTLKQIEFIGYKSIPIVILTGGFTGMVFGLQCYLGLRQFGAESMAGTLVAMAMVLELGPTLSGIMVTARAGSAMSAELGTMRVTEQIDALYSMAINPYHYLVAPRMIASMIVMPMLNVICIVSGLIGGYIVNVEIMGVNSTIYIEQSTLYLGLEQIFKSLFKAFIFGIIMSVVCCYKGFNSKGGSKGVGKSTTEAVVYACVLILMFDYILTSLLM